MLQVTNFEYCYLPLIKHQRYQICLEKFGIDLALDDYLYMTGFVATEDIKQVIDKVLTTISDWFRKVGKAIKDFFTNIFNKLFGKVNKINKSLDNFLKKIKNDNTIYSNVVISNAPSFNDLLSRMSDIIKIEQQLGGKDYKYYDNLVSNLFTQAEVIMEDERNVDQKTHPYGKVKEIKNRKVDFSSTVIPYKPLIDETFEQFKNEFISLGYEFKEKPNLGGDDKTFPFMERANFRLYEIIKTKDRLFTETNNTLSLLDSGYNSVSLNNFRSTFSNDFKKWFEKVKEFIKLFGNLQEYVTSYIESAKARVKKEKEEENNPHVYNRDGYSTHTFSTLLPLQADLKTYVDIATAMTTRSYEIIDVTEKVIETLDKSFKG